MKADVLRAHETRYDCHKFVFRRRSVHVNDVIRPKLLLKIYRTAAVLFKTLVSRGNFDIGESVRRVTRH